MKVALSTIQEGAKFVYRGVLWEHDPDGKNGSRQIAVRRCDTKEPEMLRAVTRVVPHYELPVEEVDEAIDVVLGVDTPTSPDEDRESDDTQESLSEYLGKLEAEQGE